jgi:O-antigen ligase
MTSPTIHLLASLNVGLIGITLLLLPVLPWVLDRILPEPTPPRFPPKIGVWGLLFFLVSGSICLTLALLPPSPSMTPHERTNEAGLALLLPAGVFFFLVVIYATIADTRQRLAARRKARRRVR